MQTASSGIWTRVAKYTSYDDNRYMESVKKIYVEFYSKIDDKIFMTLCKSTSYLSPYVRVTQISVLMKETSYISPMQERLTSISLCKSASYLSLYKNASYLCPSARVSHTYVLI